MGNIIKRNSDVTERNSAVTECNITAADFRSKAWRTSQEGIDLIKQFEGLRTDAYLCPAGVWTIGYGHTSGVRKGAHITEQYATLLLWSDLAPVERSINQLDVVLTQHQYDALASFVFNVGVRAFLNSTLCKCLLNGEYERVPAELRRWNKVKGETCAGLVRRREAEIKLWETCAGLERKREAEIGLWDTEQK